MSINFVSPVLTQRLDDMARLTSDFRMGQAILTENPWMDDIARWSPKATEVREYIASLEGAPEDLVELLVESVELPLRFTAKYVDSLGTLLRGHDIDLPLISVARSVFEGASRAFWIIGSPNEANPGESTLIRLLLDAHRSAILQKVTAKGLLSRNSDSVQQARADAESIRAFAESLFPASVVVDEQLGEIKSIKAVKYPALEAGVVQMFGLLHDHGNAVTRSKGRALYSFLSNHTHPTSFVNRGLRTLADEGYTGAEGQPDPGVMAVTAVKWSTYLFLELLGVTACYFGQDKTLYPALRARHAQVFGLSLEEEQMVDL